MALASESTGPPAGNGEMTRTGRLGNVCAIPENDVQTARMTPASNASSFISSLSH
jgi:hypothetical protein